MKARRKTKNANKVMIVLCRKCGWRWKPRPNMWRNRYNYGKERSLPCPQCGTVNRISSEKIKKILELNR